MATPVRQQVCCAVRAETNSSDFSHDVIDVGPVTEFNTLFETITSIAEKVDPIELSSRRVRGREHCARTSRGGQVR